MKKQLLAGTMLVAAGAIGSNGAANAQTVQLELGGYMEQIFGLVFERPPEDLTGGPVSSFDQQSEAEVWFDGLGKLDNGIEIQAHSELEVSGTPGNQIDEQYMWIRGNFGQLMLGSEDNAGHLMTIGYIGSWSTGVGQNLTFDTTDWIPLAAGMTSGGNRFNGTLNDPRLRSGDNDSSKVSYFTPRFAGFQLGASYIPNFEQQTFDSGQFNPAQGRVGGGDDLPNKNAPGLGGYNEGVAVGVNFDRKLGQFGLGVAFGYLTAKKPSQISQADRMHAYNGGVRVDFGPFRVAGGFKSNNDIFVDDATSLEGIMWDVGARFTAGPNSFSVGYRTGEIKASTADPDDDEEDAFMASYARALGPGVKWTANLLYANTESEFNNDGLPNAEYDGWAATTTIRVSF